MAKKKYGTCLLTGQEGALVKCHILPQALTRPVQKGSPLLQSTKGIGHVKRWSSWYDNSIVTRTGEDLLAEIDDAAIKQLRKTKLVWSGWGIAPPIFQRFSLLLPEHSYRNVSGLDQQAIKLFFLSVCWRASVSNLKDFSDFKLDASIEENLKNAVSSKTVNGVEFPTTLIQLSSTGLQHNHSPYLGQKTIPATQETAGKTVPFVRIYVDGLIAHVQLEAEEPSGSKTSIFLCQSPDIFVSAITYEASFQYENLVALAYESYLGLSG